jgi:hypothetical protein
MLVDAPPLSLFLLVPLLVSIPCAVEKGRFGGLLPAAVCAAAIATVMSVAIGISIAGYGPTGTSLGAAFTLIQYLPLCLGAVACWSWLAAAVGRRR